LIPKKVFTLEEVAPGEKLYQICISLKDVPEALAETAKVLADANAQIKTGAIFEVPEYHGTRFWSTFIEVSKATKGIEELVNDLRKLKVVKDVKFVEIKSAPFEVLHFPILYATTQAIVWPIGMFWSLWDAIEGILKPSGAAVLHYNTGKAVGKRVAERLRRMFGVERTDLIQTVNQAVQTTGWGIVETRNVDFKRGRETIIIRECFEALAWRKKPYKACHWVRGYMAGVASVVFDRPMEAVEIKCLATGDEYCEFKVRPEKP